MSSHTDASARWLAGEDPRSEMWWTAAQFEQALCSLEAFEHAWHPPGRGEEMEHLGASRHRERSKGIRIGIPWEKWELVDKAVDLKHPLDEEWEVPAHVAKALWQAATLGIAQDRFLDALGLSLGLGSWSVVRGPGATMGGWVARLSAQ